jgi:hypothetical protein
MKKQVKPKKRAQPIDAFALFRHAYRIWGADLHLRRIENSPEDILMIAQGSLILNAFAAELFLKCLLILILAMRLLAIDWTFSFANSSTSVSGEQKNFGMNTAARRLSTRHVILVIRSICQTLLWHAAMRLNV